MDINARDSCKKLKSNYKDLEPVKEYVDVWGNKIVIREPGVREVIGNITLGEKLPGTMIHVFMEGYFLINEEGIEVNSDDTKEFGRLVKKYKYKEKLRRKIEKDYSDHNLAEGPDNSVTIEDREIVPDCFWGIPTNDEEVEQKFNEIVKKVKAFKAVI